MGEFFKRIHAFLRENGMKKLFYCVPSALFLIFCLSGCASVGAKNASLAAIYFAVAILSLLLLVACIVLVRKNRGWFITLFSSVLVVNIGYTLLSVSTSLETALWANRVAYLGSVFLPLSMFMIISGVSGIKLSRWLCGVLGALSGVIFLIAASPGILPIYYKEVSFAVVDGVSMLVKTYGPLHPLYLVYLLGYFIAMVTVIIRAQVKKTIDTTVNVVILAIAVLVNIGVWFIEQLVDIDFEMLSVSYIISELFLLGVHLVMNEYRRMRSLIRQFEAAKEYPSDACGASERMLESPIADIGISPERIDAFMTGLKTLTPTERAIYDAYVARVTTGEIMANMGIKESTLKYHNRNIYGKLGVSSRKELLEVHKSLKSVRNVLDEKK